MRKRNGGRKKMTKHERLILGFGHFIAAGVLAFGVWVARGNLIPALLFGGGTVGMLMLGGLWMEGEI